jgi:murein DD-endopeptidase MepM/ murein hydrolase activator NlpD
MVRKRLFTALIFFIPIFLYLVFFLKNTKKASPSPISTVVLDTIPQIIHEPTLLYGFVVDSMHVIEGKIKRNQNLSDILYPYNISYHDIDVLAKQSKDVFDVRKLVVNKKYTLICEKDSVNTVAYFIYEPNTIDYVVYQLKDTILAYKRQKIVETVEKQISGVIQNSLYVDMTAKGGTPQLVNELADVFGWQIDFFRIQKGDLYKVIYEEKIVEGEVVEMGNIRGAYFNHFGNDFYGVLYDQGNGNDFFDEDGNSLRKAFLRAPVEYSRISSRYSGRRFHPVQKRWKAHLGTDYAASRGTPIRATGDGIIVEARYKKYNGNYVKIKHNGTYTTQYLHMSKIGSGIRPGVKVKQGQTIGYVGSTGLATGNHVCYRFWKNGSQVDARKVYIPPSEPIKEDHKETYTSIMNQVKTELDSIQIEDPSKELFARFN